MVGALGCVGFWLNGLGPVLPLLQRDLHASRSAVAVYPSMFALGLIGVGLLAPNLAGRRRRHTAFVIALLAMAAGAAVLSTALAWEPCLLGALAMGTGAALIVALVPALGTDTRGAAATGLLSRANALSSAAGLLAPLLTAGAIAVGAGWQAGYLAIPLLAVGALVLALHRRTLPDAGARPQTDTASPPRSAPRPEQPAIRVWLSLLLSVSVEFCMVFWAASYLRDNLGLRSATATALAGAFLVGMALGRAAIAPIARLTKAIEQTIRLAVAVAVIGFGTFWEAHAAWLAATGLALTGVGIALLYPITVARYVRAAGGSTTHASARAALASGCAIGVTPFLLALISATIGLHRAYLLVPTLFAILVINTGRGRRALVVT